METKGRISAQLATVALIGALAAATATSASGAAYPACHTVLTKGTSWLSGGGVDVKSNGSNTTTPYSCGGSTSYGLRYQCVELVERLWKSRGWVPKLGSGHLPNARDIYTWGRDRRYGLAAIPNGQLTSANIRPGDAVVWGGTAPGHVAVVRSVSYDATAKKWKVAVLQQNTPSATLTLWLTSGKLSNNSGLTTLGIVRAPGNVVDSTKPVSAIVKVSNKAVDVRGGSTANGAVLQQYTFTEGNQAQDFYFMPTSSGYYRVKYRKDTAKGWEIRNAGTTNGSAAAIWTWVGNNNQQFKPVSRGSGWYQMRPRHATDKCIDVPLASTANSVALKLYTCNTSAAQMFRFDY